MKNAKSLLWLLAGAALGAATVYILTRDDKEEMLSDIKDFAQKTKESITDKLGKLTHMAAKTASEEVSDLN
jgi:gas vesicle protein